MSVDFLAESTNVFEIIPVNDVSFNDHILPTPTLSSKIKSMQTFITAMRKYGAHEAPKCKGRMDDFLASLEDLTAAGFADGFDRPLNWPAGLLSVETSKGDDGDQFEEAGSGVLSLSAIGDKVSSLMSYQKADDDTDVIARVSNANYHVAADAIYLQWIVPQPDSNDMAASVFVQKEFRLKDDQVFSVADIISCKLIDRFFLR